MVDDFFSHNSVLDRSVVLQDKYRRLPISESIFHKLLIHKTQGELGPELGRNFRGD